MSFRSSVSHSVIPTERSERREPKGRMWRQWRPSSVTRQSRVTPSPQGEGREAPYHFGKVPCRGRGFAPYPPYVIPTERVFHFVIPTERSERRDPLNWRTFSLGDFSLRLPNGKEIFRLRLPKRLSDKISEMTVRGVAASPLPVPPPYPLSLLPPFSAVRRLKGEMSKPSPHLLFPPFNRYAI